MPQFRTGYMDPALFNLKKVIAQAKKDLKEVEFDTLVGTGFSSGVVIPALALALNKKFVLIRKDTDDSHHGKGRLIGDLGERWLFCDDFVSTGKTKQRVIEKVAAACVLEDASTTYVGDYLYMNDPKSEWSPKDRFQPFDPTDDWYRRRDLFQKEN